ncbi:MAG: PQQ-dependent sugar dehydrogenase [Pirellulaceae bacterium]
MSQSAAVGAAPRVQVDTRSILFLRARQLFAFTLVLGLMACAALAWYRWYKTPLRVSNETTRLPWSVPSDTAWTTENAYPELKFFEPTCVAFANDGSRRVFVLERHGVVKMFVDDAQTSESISVLDISDTVLRTPYEDDGAVGLVLHPEFGQADSPSRGYFYLLYTAKSGDERYNRLSRFELEGETVVDELVLIDQLNENLWHNGGGLAFGPDGFLYVGIGDEGTNGDGLQNGQRIDRDLYCGILRLDVDQRGGDVSHPIVKQPATGRTQGYFIPNDNPFVGRAGALEEFWAHGLRNPYRIAFDSANGRLWAADVGHLRREEVNLIVRGGNYGWSYREGSLAFDESYLQGRRPADLPGPEVDPVWEYPHLNGNTCVIGGFVYRDGEHASLEGKFIYADNGSGRVWALSYDEATGASNEELVALPVSSKTGIASVQPDANGEPMLVILGESGTTDGTLVRLVPAPEETAAVFPSLLSETGIFADLSSLETHPGFVKYQGHAPQAMGAAREQTWLSVPGNGHDPDPTVDRIEWRAEGPWKFPTGSTFVQHFELPIQRDGATRWMPIETRVLVRYQGQGVYGLSYRWNEQGTDATLVSRSELASFEVQDERDPHASRTQNWQFFERQACLACHNPNAGFVLGVNTGQLLHAGWNDHDSIDPMREMERRGYFRDALPWEQLAGHATMVDPRDTEQPLESRARSYLATNCAACHREGGARANFYAELRETEELDKLTVRALQADFGIRDGLLVAPGAPHRSVLYYRMSKLGQGRMPFVGAHDLDHESLRLVHDWIADLGTGDGGDDCRAIGVALNAEPSQETRAATIATLLAETDQAFALWQAVLEAEITEPVRTEVIEQALATGTPAVRDLFEWFVDAEERTQRLGTQFDPWSVLQHSGDATRGEQVFFDSQLSTCANCHAMKPGEPSLGPSLIGVGARMKRDELLEHIMQPSLKIAPEFRAVTISLIDGSVVQGIPVEEFDSTLKLRDVRGETIEVFREDIESIVESNTSLMPEDLLQGLTPQQAADLLEFLSRQRDPEVGALDGTF